MRFIALALGALVLSLSSCIKDELLNTEADIVKCILPSGVLKSEPLITNDAVQILILPGSTNLSAVGLKFELTPGATISPISGTVRNFTTPKSYKVTSEDGQWSKDYIITISQADIPTAYNFEHWKLDGKGKYQTPYELLEPGDEEMNIWASGNAGYAFVAGNNALPDDYPTYPTSDAYRGKLAAKLVTRSTGSWGLGAGMPIAAGNLFIGSFDGSIATSNPLGATHFGLPVGKKPVRFTGYYRYISGGDITGKNGKPIVPARRDKGQIYAILYETDDQITYLDGTNITTSSNILARAIVSDLTENPGTGYVAFNVNFVYTGKPFDPEKQKKYKYNLAIVFSASERGAYFEGAVGSTLYVDAVEVICEP